MVHASVWASEFVGRQAELSQIRALLADPACRLVTLVGPGGIGKTRLALEAARQLPHPENVHFVPLQPLTSPDFLVTTLGEVLGLRFYGGSEPKQQLMDYLREKAWLLVLDNFEHLLDAAALLADMLAAAPRIRLLVTSRERLNLVEEWVLEVGGLAYPAEEHAADAKQYGAVALFVQQAQRAKVGFTLTEHNRAAIGHICRLVGGMPLGIELAAAWVRALSCEAIAEEIAHSLDILETPARNIEPRHRTMRATIEPTWARLSEAERAVFMRLSVFRGGFTRAAAEQVAGASLRILSALVDKSLLRIDANGRYDLHELLRQYAADKLTEAGEANTAARRHYDYYLALAEGAEAHTFGAEQIQWFDRLQAEWDNLRAALTWSLESALGLRLATSLGWFFSERSHWNEGYNWLTRAISANPDTSDLQHAKALHNAGALAGLVRHYEEAAAFCEQSLALSRAAGDRWNSAWALCHLALYADGEMEEHEALLDESLVFFRELGDAMGLTHTLIRRNWFAKGRGDYALAQRLLMEALSLARTVGDRITSAWVSFDLGQLDWRQGHDLRQVRTHFESALSLFREGRFQTGVYQSTILLGVVEYELGNLPRAQTLCEEVNASIREAPSSQSHILFVLGWLADAMQSNGQLRRIAILFSVSTRDTPDQDATDFAWLRDQLGETAFAEAWAIGSSLTLEQGVAYAMTGRLPDDVIIPESVAAQEIAPARPANSALLPGPLTKRELEILRLIAEGFSNGEIAARLVLATSTVKWYVHEIFDKLEVTNRTQAVTRARSLDLLV